MVFNNQLCGSFCRCTSLQRNGVGLSPEFSVEVIFQWFPSGIAQTYRKQKHLMMNEMREGGRSRDWPVVQRCKNHRLSTSRVRSPVAGWFRDRAGET